MFWVAKCPIDILTIKIFIKVLKCHCAKCRTAPFNIVGMGEEEEEDEQKYCFSMNIDNLVSFDLAYLNRFNRYGVG